MCTCMCHCVNAHVLLLVAYMSVCVVHAHCYYCMSGWWWLCHGCTMRQQPTRPQMGRGSAEVSRARPRLHMLAVNSSCSPLFPALSLFRRSPPNIVYVSGMPLDPVRPETEIHFILSRSPAGNIPGVPSHFGTLGALFVRLGKSLCC